MIRPDAVLAGFDHELDWLRETYKLLHGHPEISLSEHETSGLVAESLAAFGYVVTRVGGAGVVGVLANGDGPTALARADIDALPVTEATGLLYASEVDGVMHACGHDMHVTALLGAAKLIAGGRAAWSGTYLALFQPAEEVGRGHPLQPVHGGRRDRRHHGHRPEPAASEAPGSPRHAVVGS